MTEDDLLDKIVQVVHRHAGRILDGDLEVPGPSCIFLLRLHLQNRTDAA